MAILNADGLPASKGTTIKPGGFEVAVDFDIKLGRGFVKITVPKALTNYVLSQEDGKRMIPVEEAQRVLTTPLRMMPQEAIRLGLELIQMAEEAIGSAVAMRILLETEMSPSDAVKVFMEVNSGTREDHALAWEQAMKQARQQAAMQKGDDTPRG